MTSLALTGTKEPRAVVGVTGVAIALSAPLVQWLLRPVIEALFPYPIDRFMSLWVMWGAVAVVLGLSALVEGIPLARFGLGQSEKPLRTRLLEMIAAVVLSVVLMAIIIPFSNYVREAVTGESSATVLKTIPPFWVMAPAWLTAAIAEEILFRSYPIERLGLLLGNRRLAAVIALAAFTLFHLPAWDWLHVLTIVLPFSAAITVLYLWRRSLLFVVIMHAMVNMPLLLLPLLEPYL